MKLGITSRLERNLEMKLQSSRRSKVIGAKQNTMNIFKQIVSGAAIAGLLTACGGGERGAAFTLASDAPNLSISQGATSDVLVTLTPLDGFTGDVTVSLENPPNGVYSDTLTLVPKAKKGTLTISVSPDLLVGSMGLKVIGQSGGATVSIPLNLTVTPSVPSAQALIAQALQDGKIDYPTSVLYRAYALFGNPLLPATLRGWGSENEDSSLFFEASQNDLPTNIQNQLRPFTVRPTNPQSVFNQISTQPVRQEAISCPADSGATATGWRSLKSSTYPIRIWVKCSADPLLDDFALTTASNVAERYWEPMTKLMGQPNEDDGTADQGGDTAIDFYLLGTSDVVHRDDEDRSIKGLAASIPSSPYLGNTSSGFMLLRRDRFLNSGFKSDFVHEFFHILQNKYNYKVHSEKIGDPPSDEFNIFWYGEASAVWAESYFVPETSATEVHSRFTGQFQVGDQSLHLSVKRISKYYLDMYAAYIYPFFMQQENAGKPDIIKKSWEALKSASSFTTGNELLDTAFNYKKNFRKFALRNLNIDLPPELVTGKRYIDLDGKFPDNIPPKFVAKETLKGFKKVPFKTEINPLRAAYYQFTVNDPEIRKIVFNFSAVQPSESLDIDALVNIKDKDGHKREDYNGKDKVTFCLDKPAENLHEIYLILSNHALQLDKKITGNLEVETLKAPCAPVWDGTITTRVLRTDNSSGFSYDSTITSNVVFEFDPTAIQQPGFVKYRLKNGTYTYNLISNNTNYPCRTIASGSGSMPTVFVPTQTYYTGANLVLDISFDPSKYLGGGISVVDIATTNNCNSEHIDKTETFPTYILWWGMTGEFQTASKDGDTLQGSSETSDQLGNTVRSTWKFTRRTE